MNIWLENRQDKVPLTEDVEALIHTVLNETARRHDLTELAEVSLTLVDDEQIHEINREYRDVDRPTDVISFALEEGEEPAVIGGPAEMLLGEIVISMETARRQAEEYGHTLAREVAFLALHGMLHLLGYDHMTAADEKCMFDKQTEILTALGVTRA